MTIGAEPSCQREGFQLRQKPCKHSIPARMVCERDQGGKAPEIVADTVPKRPRDKKEWSLYNEAQMAEQDRSQALLFDLCWGIEDAPQPSRGRKSPSAPLSRSSERLSPVPAWSPSGSAAGG